MSIWTPPPLRQRLARPAAGTRNSQRGWIMAPYRFAAAGPTNAGWNPADKDAHVVLSNSNKTMRGDGVLGGVRAVSGQSSGLLYFEISTDTNFLATHKTSMYVGVVSAAHSLSAQPIFGAPGGAWVVARLNDQYGNDVTGYLGTGAILLTADTVYTCGFVVDFANHRVSIYQDGTLKQANVSYTTGSTMFPFASASPTTGGDLTLRTTAAEFLQSIPGGASAWDS